jgi:hypothetical protein
MGEIADLLRLAYEVTTRSRERRNGFDDKSWDALIVTVTGLHDLLQQHEAAIRSVVSPVVYDGDLSATVRRYRELLDGVSVFSSAYEDAQGILGQAHGFKQFDEGPAKNRIDLVRHRLGEFQWAAFSLHLGSGEMANLLLESARLFEVLSGASPGREPAEVIDRQKTRVKEAFAIQAFPSLRPKRFDQGEAVEPGPLETKEDLIHLVRTWCKAWLDRINQLLYQGGPCGNCGDLRHEPSNYGLYRILGQLKAARFEG